MKTFLDLNCSLEEIEVRLCKEFAYSLHGRDFCQSAWIDLCKQNQIDVKKYLYFPPKAEDEEGNFKF